MSSPSTISKWCSKVQSTNIATRIKALSYALENNFAPICCTQLYSYTLGNAHQYILMLKEKDPLLQHFGKGVREAITNLETHLTISSWMSSIQLPKLPYLLLTKAVHSEKELAQAHIDAQTGEWFKGGYRLDPGKNPETYASWLLSASDAAQKTKLFAFMCGRIQGSMEYDLDFGSGKTQLADGQLLWLMILSRELCEHNHFTDEILLLCKNTVRALVR